MKLLLLIACTLLFHSFSYADYTEKYKGTAYSKDGKIAYVEHHDATFSDDGNIKTSKTIYKNAKGEVIGELESNFAEKLSAPAYKYVDKRHKNGHGIRYIDKILQMYKIKKDDSEKTKNLTKKFSPESLVVGCQGLHYYLKKNFDSVKNKKNIPIKFLTPGNLKYYNFIMNYTGKDKAGMITLEIKISNFFLRLFAPELVIKYDPKTKHLMTYEGLSNITDDKNEIQSVKIKYEY